MSWQYEDIVNRPHPVSQKHPPMSMLDRAAQFAPFAALTGYDEVIRETARYVDCPVELTESAKAELNAALVALAKNIHSRPRAQIIYYVPDQRKQGGSYVHLCGNVCRVDEYARAVELVDGTVIDMDSILSLEPD